MERLGSGDSKLISCYDYTEVVSSVVTDTPHYRYHVLQEEKKNDVIFQTQECQLIEDWLYVEFSNLNSFWSIVTCSMHCVFEIYLIWDFSNEPSDC